MKLIVEMFEMITGTLLTRKERGMNVVSAESPRLTATASISNEAVMKSVMRLCVSPLPLLAKRQYKG